jgi:hypothetical protein
MACLLLASCAQPGLDPIPLSAVPSERPIPTATLDFSGARATLTVIRGMKVSLGDITITAAIPLLFAIDEDDPESPVIVWGTGTGAAVLNGIATGTGGSYTINAEWPVEYDVKGNLTPSREVCRLSLTVDEILLLSEEVVAHLDPLGDLLMSAGDDQFTTFTDLQFTETESTVTRGQAPVESVFSIDDWCLPEATYCTYGCSP